MAASHVAKTAFTGTGVSGVESWPGARPLAARSEAREAPSAAAVSTTPSTKTAGSVCETSAEPTSAIVVSLDRLGQTFGRYGEGARGAQRLHSAFETRRLLMNRRWHVVFGTGALGLAVARALVQRGARVRMVNRTGVARHAPDGVEMISADAYDPSQARAACDGAEVVYQCAAPRYTEWAERFPALQTSIVDAASQVGVRLVVGDNLYMYGCVAGPLVETLPHGATTKKGRVRARLAASLLTAHNEGRVRVTIGRGSDFFGPAVVGSVVGERFFRAALEGRPVDVFANAHAPHSYTFIDDFGAALVELGERDEAFGRAWHVPSLPAVSSRQFAQTVIAAAGTRSAIREVPRWTIRVCGLVAPPVREMIEMLYMFEKPFVVDDSAFTRAFATPATPLAAAVEKTLRWYAAAGQSAA